MTSKLNEEDILNDLNSMSDEMAMNSDDGGDYDAEDEQIFSVPIIPHQIESSPIWRLKTRSSGNLH